MRLASPYLAFGISANEISGFIIRFLLKGKAKIMIVMVIKNVNNVEYLIRMSIIKI